MTHLRLYAASVCLSLCYCVKEAPKSSGMAAGERPDRMFSRMRFFVFADPSSIEIGSYAPYSFWYWSNTVYGEGNETV